MTINEYRIPESELILNPDGSVFHLHLLPHHLADTVILVGDPGRVNTIASYFEKIEYTIENREFKTVTGFYKKKHISIISTGIGTDNIDIVLNELDALVNIDFQTRTIKDKKKSLEIIRIGTSGGLHTDIPVNSFVLSEYSIGFDGLLNFYKERNSVCNLEFEHYFTKQVNWSPLLTKPYVVKASSYLLHKLESEKTCRGTTISAPGFYGPQGRQLRLAVAAPGLNDMLAKFNYKGNIITNYEMESSAIAGLSALLGHEAITICLIIANRVRKEYSKDYKVHMQKLIQYVLERI